MSVLDEVPVSQGFAPEAQEQGLIEARRYIGELLSSPVCPPYTMNMEQLDGYLRAVAAEPKATNPKDWMPLVFGGELPRIIYGYSIDSITNALICLYNSHRTQVLNGTCVIAFPCEFSPIKSDRLKCEQWARGFMQGYIFWQDVWSQYLDESQTDSNLAVILPSSVYDEMDAILATVTAVADAEYALQLGTKSSELVQLFQDLPQKIVEYGRIAHMIRKSSVDVIS